MADARDRPQPVEAVILECLEITPTMRRLVVGGADLAAFRERPNALGPYLKLHLAGPDGRAVVRTYSARCYDPERNRLAIEILVHGEASPGSRVGATARPGDPLRISGPGFIPAEPVRSYLLAGDHTALPAIASILEQLPAGVVAQVAIEVPDRAEEQPMPSAAAANIAWLHRRPGMPSRLPDAVREIGAKLAGETLVWAGAEAMIARAIRRDPVAREVRQGGRCQILNYWNLGRSEGSYSFVD